MRLLGQMRKKTPLKISYNRIFIVNCIVYVYLPFPEKDMNESPLILLENENMTIMQINYEAIFCVLGEFLLFQNNKVEGTLGI